MSDLTRIPIAVDLSRFRVYDYDPGRSFASRAVWFAFGLPVLRSSLLPSSSLKRALLRIFGARILEGAVIRPGVRVKYPWRLTMGRNCWLGEDVWIDNVAQVTLGDNVCISQGAYLCTGNHDWTDAAFRLMARPITVHDSAWLAARCAVGPGVVIGRGAVVGLGAVVSADVPPGEVYAGNPAVFVRHRNMGAESELALIGTRSATGSN